MEGLGPVWLWDRFDTFHGHCQCAEIFLHLAVKDKWAASVQDGTEPAIDFGEKGGLHQSGFILEGEKLHGIALFGTDDLSRNQQTGNRYTPVYETG